MALLAVACSGPVPEDGPTDLEETAKLGDELKAFSGFCLSSRNMVMDDLKKRFPLRPKRKSVYKMIMSRLPEELQWGLGSPENKLKGAVKDTFDVLKAKAENKGRVDLVVNIRDICKIAEGYVNRMQVDFTMFLKDSDEN